MKKYNFTYLIINTINGHKYIGDHSTDDLDDNYLGSGIYLNRAKKKYGKANFKKEILEQFNTKEEAFNAQEKYIKKYNTLSPNGYNISPKGGHLSKNSLSKDTKIKISDSLSGEKHFNYGKKTWMCGRKHSDETKKKMSEARKGKVPSNKGIKMSDEVKEKISSKLSGKNHPNWNKKLSEKTKKKISENNIGKHNFNHTKETKDKISKNHARVNLNKKLSKETRKKMSESHLGKKRGKYKKIK